LQLSPSQAFEHAGPLCVQLPPVQESWQLDPVSHVCLQLPPEQLNVQLAPALHT
jgi:hypothetical protein